MLSFAPSASSFQSGTAEDKPSSSQLQEKSPKPYMARPDKAFTGPWLWTMAALNCLTLLLLIWYANPQSTTDFASFYTAAHMFKNGQPIFNLSAQLSEEKRLTGAHNLPFLHLPYELLPVLPLTALDYKSALLVWRLAGLGILVAVYFAFLKAKHWVLIVAFFPVAICFYQGQDSFLSLLIFGAAYGLLQSNHNIMAGVLFGIACYKPHLILPITLLFLIKRRISFLVGVTTSIGLMLIVSSMMVNLSGISALLQMIRVSQQPSLDLGVHPTMMPNLRGLISTILPWWDTQAFSALISLSLPIMVGCILNRKTTSADLFLVGTVCVILASFNTNVHDLVLLLVPIFYVPGYPRATLALTCIPLQLLLVYFETYSLLALLVIWLLVEVVRRTQKTGWN